MELNKAYIPIIKYCLSMNQIESAKKKYIYAMNANVLEAMVIYACLTHDSQDNRDCNDPDDMYNEVLKEVNKY